MPIRETTAADRATIYALHKAAFGSPQEAELTLALLDDATAQPALSLLAEAEDGTPQGHILFTAAFLDGPEDPPRCAHLCPLAVHPDAQGQGVGRDLVGAGLKMLHADGCALVFVFGDPAYYGKFGFAPAGPLGFTAPHPIPEKHSDAWMVEDLEPGAMRMEGTVRVAAAVDRAELWEV